VTLLRFRESGSGPAVLLLHGSPSTSASLEPLAERLSASRRVLVPDLPGYAAAQPLPEPYSYDRVRAILEEELVALGVSEVAVVGHSAGGYRALALALDARRVRVTAIVTLGGIAGVDDDARDAYRQFAAMMRAGLDFGAMWLDRFTAPGFAARFPSRASGVMAWMSAAPREVLAAELEAFGGAPDLRPRLGEIAVPVTARVGALDVATPPACSEDIVRRVQHGRLQVVPGCGHALVDEDREGTVEAVVAGV
jgi:pimeloyl-ACP methyl ester carboxylesterase